MGQGSELARAAEQIDVLSTQAGDPQSRAITLFVQAGMYDAALATAKRQLALRPDAAMTLYQSHRAFISAGKITEARALLSRLSATSLQDVNLLLADLRQACAESRIDEARAARSRIDEIGHLAARWIAAQTMGDDEAAADLLRPLDTPENLPRLIQFMIYPTFDVSRYPVLDAALRHAGIAPSPPIAVPRKCVRY